MNKYLILLIIIGGVVLTYFYQKKIQNDLLNKLYKYKANKQEKEFMDLLDSNYVRFVFSSFTIEFMKFNYYLDNKDYKRAKKSYQSFKNIKLNNRNLIALNLRMFNSAIEAKDYSFASSIKDILLPVLSKKNDNDSKIIKGEIEQIDKIYIQKDTSIIDDLVDALNDCENDEIKSIICFRIAKLYHYQNNENKVNEYLNKAKEYTTSEFNKNSLELVLNNHKELD